MNVSISQWVKPAAAAAVSAGPAAAAMRGPSGSMPDGAARLRRASRDGGSEVRSGSPARDNAHAVSRHARAGKLSTSRRAER